MGENRQYAIDDRTTRHVPEAHSMSHLAHMDCVPVQFGHSYYPATRRLLRRRRLGSLPEVGSGANVREPFLPSGRRRPASEGDVSAITTAFFFRFRAGFVEPGAPASAFIPGTSAR